MTISVGFLEIGELGSDLDISLLKTMLITGSALFFMALVGFNTAFAPTINGVIGNPLYNGLFLGGSSTSIINGPLASAWWSQQSSGLATSPQVPVKLNLPWLTLSILLLWVGWFGFNPGSVLAFNNEAMVVVVTTFLAAASAFLSVMFFRYQMTKEMPSLIYAANGVLMGLIVITPLAGFVSPLSAVVLGLLGGPLYLAGEKWFGKFKWFTDPVGLFPGHLLGGTFGVLMIPFFAQKAFASALASLTFENGALVATSLPDGLFYGGGLSALNQLGIEAYGVAVVMLTVFILSFVTARLISAAMKGITTNSANN